MNVRITQSLPKYWYSTFVGTVFSVRKVNAGVFGRAHTLNIYEVVGGEHDGDYILCGHAEVVQ